MRNVATWPACLLPWPVNTPAGCLVFVVTVYLQIWRLPWLSDMHCIMCCVMLRLCACECAHIMRSHGSAYSYKAFSCRWLAFRWVIRTYNILLSSSLKWNFITRIDVSKYLKMKILFYIAFTICLMTVYKTFGFFHVLVVV